MDEAFPLNLVIVPTLSPLEINEKWVQEETLRRNRFSRLSSRHFRNRWFRQTDEEFLEFAELVSAGWPGFELEKPRREGIGENAIVEMHFRHGRHYREVRMAGFGFQVWMQTMSHLHNSDHNSVLVLDEPDVYLHPDLQHKLLRIVGQRTGQYFIATHSSEIINDADAGDVVIVRPGARSAKRIQSDTDFAQVFSAIGSSENAQFARLAKTGKVLFFEGQDFGLFSKISKKFLFGDFLSKSHLTVMETKGFENWRKVTSTAWVFNEFFEFNVEVGAVFDRDYRCQEAVDDFLVEVSKSDVSAHVLPVKEVENILLVPRAILAVVQKFSAGELGENWEVELQEEFWNFVDEERDIALSRRIGLRTEFELGRSKANPTEVSAREATQFGLDWKCKKFRLKVVGGKTVLSKIRRLCSDRWKVSVTDARIVSELRESEIDPEVLEMLKALKEHYRDT